MKPTLHAVIAGGTLALVAAGLGLTALLIDRGVDGNGVAVLVGIVTLVAGQLGRIVQHLFPAPEWEAEPPAKRNQSEGEG